MQRGKEGKSFEIPFNELHWEDFERLCLRLAKTEANVEFCNLYGRRGQKQHGIDIFARKSLGEKYTVYQCKQVDKFYKRDIETVVSNFLSGQWAKKSDCFILCTSLNLRDADLQDKIEEPFFPHLDQSRLIKQLHQGKDEILILFIEIFREPNRQLIVLILA